MKFSLFACIIMANLQFHDADQSDLELVKNMKEVINRLNKIEEENLELKSNISQRMSLIESNIDVILRNNGKDFHSCMQYFEQGITKNGYYYMKQETNSISRVYCEFEGMDQRYSKYLIVSTGNPWGDKNNEVEIVDISDPTKNCNLLEEIHPQEAYTDTGGLLGKNPVICRRNECMVFGTSIKTIAMKKRRSLFSAVSLNSSMLWLLGSDGRPSDDSTEFISLSEGAIDGPRMPITLSGSCVVKYNDTSIYILGGIQNYTRSLKEYNDRNVWIASISDEITFSQGPSMLQGRYFHACGTISFGNKNLIIVAGGMTSDKNSGVTSSVEILDPSTNRWVQGPDLPYFVYKSQMVTSSDGKGIILIGGNQGGRSDVDPSVKLLQLKREANGWASSWTTMKQKLKYGRQEHVAIPISNELTTCE